MMTCIQFQFCYRIQCRQTHTTSLPLSDLINLLRLYQHTLERTYTNVPRRIQKSDRQKDSRIFKGTRIHRFYPTLLRYEET